MISIIHQYAPQRIVCLCYSLAYFYFVYVMILTTLSDLPLLFLLRCTEINCCYTYNIHYCPQRCRLVTLSPLLSSLFRCGSVCCFLYTHRARVSGGYCCIYHTLLIISCHQRYSIFYTTLSRFIFFIVLYFLQHSYVLLCTA